MSPSQSAGVAHEQRPVPIGEEQPFVRIESDGICSLDALQHLTPPLREHKEPSVRSVHVEPEALLLRRVRDAPQVVDGTGVGGPGTSHHQERLQPCLTVFGDSLLQDIQAQLVTAIGGYLANVLFREARQDSRFTHRVMRLVRRVDRPQREVVGKPFPPCRYDRGEIGQRSTAGEDAACVWWITDNVAKPPNDVHLELHQPRCGNPHTDVSIHGVGNEIGDGGRKQAPTRDVSEVTRSGCVVGERDGPLEQEVQQ